METVHNLRRAQGPPVQTVHNVRQQGLCTLSTSKSLHGGHVHSVTRFLLVTVVAFRVQIISNSWKPPPRYVRIA